MIENSLSLFLFLLFECKNGGVCLNDQGSYKLAKLTALLVLLEGLVKTVM